MHKGPPVNVQLHMKAHCVHVISANDTKRSVFGHQTYPPLLQGLNKVHLAPEASALTTELAYKGKKLRGPPGFEPRSLA